MKKYKFYFLGLFATVTTLQSCESYLEEINPNEVSSATYWSDLEESEENLTSVYNGMLNQYIYSFDNESLRGDMGFPNDRTRYQAAGYEWHSQNFSNTISTHYFKSWAGMYRVIWRANQVIDGLNGMDDAIKSQDRWTTQMAEARFFRGLMHFYLNSNYNNGEIIIRDKIPTNLEDYSTKTSPSEEVRTFFRTDLQFAYDNLPNIRDEKTRVSKGTAALVLGKSYLYSASEGNTTDYDKAMPLLKDVIEGPYGYSLLTGDNVELLYTSKGDYNSESIFEINYSDAHQRLIQNKDEWDEEAYTNRWARYTAPSSAEGGASGSNYFSPTSWLAYAYSSEAVNPNDIRNYVTGTNASKNVSLRCSQMIAVVNDEATEYYKASAANEVASFGKGLFAYFKKFTNHDTTTTESDDLSSAWPSSKNVVVYRLADAYLMYAECLIQKGSLAEATDYINKIRDRWGLQLLGTDDGTETYDNVSYTQETLMDHLMYNERPLEVGLDGYAERSIDLRRWGVKKSRLEDLANTKYHVIDYSFTKDDGTSGKGSMIQKGLSPNTVTDLYIEFEDAAKNYQESLHAYLPLPNEETLYNQEVD